MDAAKVRYLLTAINLDGNMGTIAEGPFLLMLQRACKGRRIRIIRSFDFARCDFMIVYVDGDKVDYPFPDDTPFSNFERLAWAWHHKDKLHGITCDVKTGPPNEYWMAEGRCNAKVFFVRMVEEGHLFVIPKYAVQALFSARQGRNQIDEQPEVFPSYPGLAPFAVRDDHWPEMLERLARPASPAASSGAWDPRWELPAPQPLNAMFQMVDHGHDASFKRVWELYQCLKRWQPDILFHHVLTQPYGGDFVLKYKGERYSIQHKSSLKDPTTEVTCANFFDLIFWHQGSDEDKGNLVVKYRDGNQERAFSYDQKGADGIAKYLEEFGGGARQLHAVAMTNLLAEQVPEASADAPKSWERPRAGEEEATRRTKSRCHYMAKRFYNFVNGDPDQLNIPLACIFLNWDQSHIYGEAIVLPHKWTTAERDRFRKFGSMPISLVDLAVSKERVPRFFILRFCCRDYHHRNISGTHFPLQQVPVEMPLTDQPFFLICAPDNTLVDEMPDSLMLFPSQFSDWPAKVEQVWRDNRGLARNQERTEYQLNLLLGHCQPSRAFKNGPMVKEGVVQANFWLTPENVLRHLEEMFHTDEDMVIQHHEGGQTNAFNVTVYMTEIDHLLDAATTYGSVRPGSPWSYRPWGFYGSLRV